MHGTGPSGKQFNVRIHGFLSPSMGDYAVETLHVKLTSIACVYFMEHSVTAQQAAMHQ
jgi:hypothetical protein